MTTIKFEIFSDKAGIFNVDLSNYSDDQLDIYIKRDQYLRIISKINERIKSFKSPINASCVVGVIIIILSLMVFLLVQIQSPSITDIYMFIIFMTIVLIIMICYAGCRRYNNEGNETRFKKLQSDIQTIADEEFMTVYRIAYARWIIEKIRDTTSNTKFKLTVEFRLQQPRAVSSVHEPIDSRSTRVEDSPASVLVLDFEPITTLVGNEQCVPYVTAPATPPPPSYQKVIHLFSQASFSDCPNCRHEKSVFDEKYCTQCGYHC